MLNPIPWPKQYILPNIPIQLFSCFRYSTYLVPQKSWFSSTRIQFIFELNKDRNCNVTIRTFMSRQDLLCVLFQKSFCYSYVLIWRQSFVFSSGKVWRGQSIHDLAQSKKLSSETFSQMTLKTLTQRKDSLVVISTLNYQIEFFLIIQKGFVVIRGVDNQINQKKILTTILASALLFWTH